MASLPASTASGKAVEGRLYYDVERHDLYVTAKGLLPAGDGRTFVLWTLPKGAGAPKNVGTFSLLPAERPDLVLAGAPAPGDVAGYAVSSERDPAVTAPTAAEIRAVAFSPP